MQGEDKSKHRPNNGKSLVWHQHNIRQFEAQRVPIGTRIYARKSRLTNKDQILKRDLLETQFKMNAYRTIQNAVKSVTPNNVSRSMIKHGYMIYVFYKRANKSVYVQYIIQYITIYNQLKKTVRKDSSTAQSDVIRLVLISQYLYLQNGMHRYKRSILTERPYQTTNICKVPTRIDPTTTQIIMTAQAPILHRGSRAEMSERDSFLAGSIITLHKSPSYESDIHQARQT